MASHPISAARLIDAPPQQVYQIIADYRDGHQQIIPRPPFVSLEVEQGGVGAGSVLRIQMRMLGQLHTFRSIVTEPEPGRVLVESNDNGHITTFTVEPRDDGRRSDVTILTQALVRDGIFGPLEGWFLGRLLRPVYVKELERLAEVAARAEMKHQ